MAQILFELLLDEHVKEVIEKYRGLWQIEESFKITKGTEIHD